MGWPHLEETSRDRFETPVGHAEGAGAVSAPTWSTPRRSAWSVDTTGLSVPTGPARPDGRMPAALHPHRFAWSDATAPEQQSAAIRLNGR